MCRNTTFSLLFDQEVPATLKSNPYKILSLSNIQILLSSCFVFTHFQIDQGFFVAIVTMRIMHFLCCELDKTKYAWKMRFLFDSLNKGFWTMENVFVSMYSWMWLF